MEMNMWLASVKPADNLLFDWELDVTRLEREAQAAAAAARPDPWCLAEAECSLDLIEAELVAVRSLKAHPGYAASEAKLALMRTRLRDVIDLLSTLPAN